MDVVWIWAVLFITVMFMAGAALAFGELWIKSWAKKNGYPKKFKKGGIIPEEAAPIPGGEPIIPSKMKVSRLSPRGTVLIEHQDGTQSYRHSLTEQGRSLEKKYLDFKALFDWLPNLFRKWRL